MYIYIIYIYTYIKQSDVAEIVYTTALHHTAANCSTLQHTAAHCNTLQHTATHCAICGGYRNVTAMVYYLSQLYIFEYHIHIAYYISVLQYVAVDDTATLQHIAIETCHSRVHITLLITHSYSLLLITFILRFMWRV